MTLAFLLLHQPLIIRLGAAEKRIRNAYFIDVLESGELVEYGSNDELLTHPGAYVKLCDDQTGKGRG